MSDTTKPSRFHLLDLEANQDLFNRIVVAAQELEYALEDLPPRPANDYAINGSNGGPIQALEHIVYMSKKALFP